MKTIVSIIRSGMLAFMLASPMTVFAESAATNASGNVEHIVGKVVYVVGQAELITKEGITKPIVTNMYIPEGSRLITKDRSKINFQFQDHEVKELGANSALDINIFRYDASHPEDSAVLNTLKAGEVKVKTGEAGHYAPENYRLNTLIAAIGVLGTEYTVQIRNGQTIVILNKGKVSVARFSEDCTPDSLGPCAGESSIRLTEQQRGLAAVVKEDQPKPIIMPAPQALRSQVAASPVATVKTETKKEETASNTGKSETNKSEEEGKNSSTTTASSNTGANKATSSTESSTSNTAKASTSEEVKTSTTASTANDETTSNSTESNTSKTTANAGTSTATTKTSTSNTSTEAESLNASSGTTTSSGTKTATSTNSANESAPTSSASSAGASSNAGTSYSAATNTTVAATPGTTSIPSSTSTPLTNATSASTTTASKSGSTSMDLVEAITTVATASTALSSNTLGASSAASTNTNAGLNSTSTVVSPSASTTLSAITPVVSTATSALTESSGTSLTATEVVKPITLATATDLVESVKTVAITTAANNSTLPTSPVLESNTDLTNGAAGSNGTAANPIVKWSKYNPASTVDGTNSLGSQVDALYEKVTLPNASDYEMQRLKQASTDLNLAQDIKLKMNNYADVNVTNAKTGLVVSGSITSDSSITYHFADKLYNASVSLASTPYTGTFTSKGSYDKGLLQDDGSDPATKFQGAWGVKGNALEAVTTFQHQIDPDLSASGVINWAGDVDSTTSATTTTPVSGLVTP